MCFCIYFFISFIFFCSNNHKATVTTESVNYQRSRTKKDLFLLYLNEVRSNLRRTTIVRETSVISPLSVLLFKQNELKLVNEVEGDEAVLVLEGTRLKFSCTKRYLLAIFLYGMTFLFVLFEGKRK